MAADLPPAWPADALEVGRIGEAWGLRGDFRVLPFADPPDALSAARHWHLRPPADRIHVPAGAAPLLPSLRVSTLRQQGDGYVASSPDVADRTAAEALRGARVFVSRAQFPAAGDDEYYWADLIGMSVVIREGEALGAVVDLLDNGAQSVLRVRPVDADAGERLIPFVAAYVDSVGLAERRIVVDWGLDY